MKVIVLCVTLLLFMETAVAQTPTICSQENSISMFFGNGMFNDAYEAELSKLVLQGKIKPLLPEGTIAQYAVSYNRNENTLLQLVEAASQKQMDNWSHFFNWLSGMEAAPDWFREKMEALASGVDKLSYVIDADLQQHVQRYRRAILEGKKVIVVSHSQGNFYANRAYGGVSSDSFGIVAVATPANLVAGSGPYTTLTNDLVMNVVRIIDPNTLPANTSNGSQGEWSGHAFIESYLNGDVSGNQVIGHILDKMNVLPSPLPNLVGSGDIGIDSQGNSVAIIDIYNGGGSVAVATTHDVYLAFDFVSQVGTVATPALAPGESITLRLPFPHPGNICMENCVVAVVVDAPQSVRESNEADNCNICHLVCKFLGELCLCGA